MGQKINPFGYRLGITESHRSKWFSDSNKVGERYSDFVLEDDKIRTVSYTHLTLPTTPYV